MDITAQSSFLRILWFNSDTGLLTGLTSHTNAVRVEGAVRGTQTEVCVVERDQPRREGSGSLSQRAWRLQRTALCTLAGGSGQRPVTGPAYSQPFEREQAHPREPVLDHRTPGASIFLFKKG